MNKTKLVLPLAALLMIPAISGCDTKDRYEASFNNDQHISAHGPQIIDITLDKYVKGKMHFKDTLESSMFEMPDPYKNKEITSAYSYNNGDSAVLIFGDKDGTTVEMTEDVDNFNINVKEEAFKESNLGGKISVTMYKNQIQYAGYTHSYIDANGNFRFEGLINVIGEVVSVFDEGIGSGGDGTYYAVTTTNSNTTIDSARVALYQMKGYQHFLEVSVAPPSGESWHDEKFKLTFKSGSTNLKKYHCTIELDGLPSKDHFTFEEDSD